MPKVMITIRPDAFDSDSWIELYYACELIPRRMGDKAADVLGPHCKIFKASLDRVTKAYQSCLGKAQSIKTGLYGPQDEPGQNKKWIADLKRAAKLLNLEITLAQVRANQLSNAKRANHA